MKRYTKASVFAFTLTLSSVLLFGNASIAVSADMVVGQSGLSDTEQVLLYENPALAEIAGRDPQLLQEILGRISHVLANPSVTRGGLPLLDEETVHLLERNPALIQAWQSSPEASADLLQLIRIAAGGGKPRK